MKLIDKSGKKTMRTFWIIWSGQFISMLGSGLTSFALGVWIYAKTGEATPFAMTALFSSLPRLLLLPIGGTFADRYNRRKIMILTDIGAAMFTAFGALLLFFGELQIWHIYIIAFCQASLSALQGPAYSASITMLVPKKDLARASAINQVGEAASSILTPILAGSLYALIALKGIILIDFITAFFAVGALLLIRIPQPKRVTETKAEQKSVWVNALFGWKYLRALPGLLSLLLYFASVNFFLGLSGVLTIPLVLAFGTSTDLGIVQMASGIAMLVGGIIMGSWGGPKGKKIPWVIGLIIISATGLLIMGLKANTLVIASGYIVLLFFIPSASALSSAVFQVKIPADIQGRVFAIRAMIAQSMMPLAYLISGPLADRIFEPLMMPEGALGQTFLGKLIGTGTGRGIALIFIFVCIFLWIESLAAFVNPRIRNVEDEIPDAIPDDVEEQGTSANAKGAMLDQTVE